MLMNQIPVGFDKKTEEKLRRNAKAKEMKLAQYIRTLVDIGLQVEEMSERKESAKESKDSLMSALEFQQKLLQKGLISSYEILYLTRYILAKLPEDKSGEHNQILDSAQTKAKSLVEGLLG